MEGKELIYCSPEGLLKLTRCLSLNEFVSFVKVASKLNWRDRENDAAYYTC